jgi:chromate reductase, NAD(P)H dehydrogenase (quinone)
MTTIVGISGSLRRASYDTSLLRAAAQLMPNNAQLRIETIRGIPLYDGDLEAAEGISQPVTALKEAVASADGLLLATPEYNNQSRAYSRTRSTGSRGHRQTFPAFLAGSRSH